MLEFQMILICSLPEGYVSSGTAAASVQLCVISATSHL